MTTINKAPIFRIPRNGLYDGHTRQVSLYIPDALYAALEFKLAQEHLTIAQYLKELLATGAKELGLGNYAGTLTTSEDIAEMRRVHKLKMNKTAHLQYVPMEMCYVDEADFPSNDLTHSPQDLHLAKVKNTLTFEKSASDKVKKLHKEIYAISHKLAALRNSSRFDSIYSGRRCNAEEARAELMALIELLPTRLQGIVQCWTSVDALTTLLADYVKICRSELEALTALDKQAMPKRYREAWLARLERDRMLAERTACSHARSRNPQLEDIGWASDFLGEQRLELAFDPPPSNPTFIRSECPHTRGQDVLVDLLERSGREFQELEAYLDNTVVRDLECGIVALDLALMPIQRVKKIHRPSDRRNAEAIKRAKKRTVPITPRVRKAEPYKIPRNIQQVLPPHPGYDHFRFRPVCFNLKQGLASEPLLLRGSYDVEEVGTLSFEQPPSNDQREGSNGVSKDTD